MDQLSESVFRVNFEKEHPFTMPEIRMALLALRGFTNKQIADKLRVTTDCIYKRRRHAADKVGVETFEGALGWMVGNGVIVGE